MRAGALLFTILICGQVACGGDELTDATRLADGGYASPATCTAGTPTPPCDIGDDPGTV